MQHTERHSKVEVEDREKEMAEAQAELRTGITLTERAAGKLKKILAEQEMPEGSCLRVGIKGGGCSGFSYTLDVTEKPAGDDEVFESNGLHVVCDPKSYLYISGTEIDYEDALLNGGFVFNNPNSKRTCGCGASFAV
jgi:iron-sulfur cluster assembly protein